MPGLDVRHEMKKTALLYIPVVALFILIMAIPGMFEYLQLRYFGDHHPKTVEVAVAMMKKIYSSMDEELPYQPHITAKQIRESDPEKMRRFWTEFNRSIEVEHEFAFTRTLTYYKYWQAYGIERMKEEMMLHFAEDYQRYTSVPYSDPNNVPTIIEGIAQDEPTLATLIKRENLDEPVDTDNPVNPPENSKNQLDD